MAKGLLFRACLRAAQAHGIKNMPWLLLGVAGYGRKKLFRKT